MLLRKLKAFACGCPAVSTRCVLLASVGLAFGFMGTFARGSGLGLSLQDSPAQQGSAAAVAQWEGRVRNTGVLILSGFSLSRCPGSAAPIAAFAVPKALAFTSPLI